MINSIVNTLAHQAREHRSIKTFYYHRNYELGSGKDTHPLFWLEDPIYGRNQDNTFVNSVNFAILFAPDKERNIADLQNMAFSIGLNIIERIKQDASAPFSIRPDWTFTLLRNYYDDDACGCRFSVNVAQRNMQNLCLIEEQFDIDKQWPETEHLPEFDTTSGRQTFAGKLPVFDLKTRK